MANFVYNYAKGRAVEFYVRVDTNDPAASELVVTLLAASGIETDAALMDSATFAEVIDGTTNEATNTGYARKVLGDIDLSAFTPDTANDRADIDIADQTWTGVANDGTGAIGDVVICYDPVGSQTNTDMIPITQHDFAITPDGSDVTAQITNFFRAS